jgi:hypothetical protein
MKNKGYYGWIHSLNEAAMQSQQNGIDMLAEQAARKGEMLTEAKKPNRTPEGIAAKRAREAAYSVTRAEKNKAAKLNPGEFIDQGADQTRAEIHSAGMRAGNGTKRVEGGYRKGEEISTDEIDLNTDDDSETGEHAGIEYIPGNRLPDYNMDAERALTAQLAQQQDRTSKPRDVNQDGIANAQDSEADGADGEINGAGLDAQFMRRRVQPRFAPRTESVSHKISKMLRN